MFQQLEVHILELNFCLTQIDTLEQDANLSDFDKMEKLKIINIEIEKIGRQIDSIKSRIKLETRLDVN